MSTTAVITASTKQNKFESILTGIGKAIQATENGIINITGAEKTVLTQLLSPNISGPLLQAQQVAASTFATMEATEQKIGAQAIPYVQKVALIVALQGANIAKILASAGLESGQESIQTIVTTATGISTIGKITATPVAPTSSTSSTAAATTSTSGALTAALSQDASAATALPQAAITGTVYATPTATTNAAIGSTVATT